MKESVTVDYKGREPRAIVLDDNARSRLSISRELRSNGFAVKECESVPDFQSTWAPGMFDLIVADWQLSDDVAEHGDKVLEEVRRRDWDVPFVLISGKLDEHGDRPAVLQALLEQGQARFVQRGDDGFDKVSEEAASLLERRDATLLNVILALRDAADAEASFQTTQGGRLKVREQLADLVASPDATRESLRPLSGVRASRYKSGA